MQHSGNGWRVSYRRVHGGRYGMYTSLRTARGVEHGLQRRGYLAWIRSHRMY
jgi:hypothetical protein